MTMQSAVWTAAPALVCWSLFSPSLPAKPPWRAAGGNARLETAGNVSRLVGKGWVRTSRAYLNSRIDLEFRPVGSGSEGALVLRALVPRPGAEPRSGYRVALKPGEPVTVTTISRRSANATVVPSVVREGEWHDLSVLAADDRVTVSLDGRSAATVAGREHQVGYIGLEVKRGTMEFRRIRISEAAPTACTREPTKEGPSPETPRPRGIALPRVTREVRPNYTIEALNDRVEGDVWVEAVVLPDGTVGETCVRRSLHADLDVEALAAARQWLFAPGRRDNQPVPVLVTIELSFSLKR